MRLPVVAFAVLTLPLIAAGCAPSTDPGVEGADPQARPCFMANMVTNFRSGDGQNLYLRAGRNGGVFELQSVGFCRDLDWAQSIAIAPEFGSGARLCPGDRVTLAYRGGGAMPNGPCRAVVERKLTEAEVEALPSRSRP